MFRTKYPQNKASFQISHKQNLLLLGSCFTENIGNKLIYNKFNTTTNPFGILYNPISIFNCLDAIASQKKYTDVNLVFNNEQWHSLNHHSVFSNPNKAVCLNNINETLIEANNNVSKSNICIISLGTAWVHTYTKTDEIVGNCHKIPNSEFTKTLLTVNQITTAFNQTLNHIKKINPKLEFIFTVSPVRHIKDGFHENQLSKATLLLAINELQQKHKSVHYFPAYELLMDDLRDYRFYEDDMLHPSKKAIEYIWDHFTETFFSDDTKKLCVEISKIKEAENHKAFNPKSEAHKMFLKNLENKKQELQKNNPEIIF